MQPTTAAADVETRHGEAIRPSEVLDESGVISRPPGDEQVERPSSEVAVRDDTLTDAALAMPGVPGREEFIALAMQARILSMSGAAPKAIRGNPYIAFHVAMVGRDLGISPSAAMNLIDIIGEDDKAHLSLSPQLLNGQIRRLGLGRVVPVERTERRCVARAIDSHGEILGESEFTWEDATEAGLVGKECEPGSHKAGTWADSGRPKPCDCRQGWRTYSKRMLWWRAAGYCADDYFPEAGLGLYSAEELGAVVDADGRPVDPATIELPEGYEPPRQLSADERAQSLGWTDDEERKACAQLLSEVVEYFGPETRNRLTAWREERKAADDEILLYTAGGWVRGVGAAHFYAAQIADESRPAQSPAGDTTSKGRRMAGGREHMPAAGEDQR